MGKMNWDKTYRDKPYRPQKSIGYKTYQLHNISATKCIDSKTYHRSKCIGIYQFLTIFVHLKKLIMLFV